MTLKNQIMKLQTYKMYEDEDTVYVERDDVLKLLDQQPCEDCISREAVENITWEEPSYTDVLNVLAEVREKIRQLPPITPEAKWIPVSERLPEEATNGDMIKTLFPDVEVKEKNNGYEVYFGVGTAIQFFNHQWWNAPYKVESEG